MDPASGKVALQVSLGRKNSKNTHIVQRKALAISGCNPKDVPAATRGCVIGEAVGVPIKVKPGMSAESFVEARQDALLKGLALSKSGNGSLLQVLACLLPGTKLYAKHFVPGQLVDVQAHSY